MLFHLSSEMPSDNLMLPLFPRVPPCRANGEDGTIPRSCFSDSILGCIKAIPDRYDGVFNRVYLQGEKGIPALFSVYKIEENELPEGVLRTPEGLKELVPDAVENREYWVTDISLNAPFYGLIWVKEIEIDEKGNIKTCTFQFSKTTKSEYFRFTFIYESEWLLIKELVEKHKGSIIEEREIGVVEDCYFSHIYVLEFSVPEGADMREIWQTYFDIRTVYDEELCEEDFLVLKTYEHRP